MAAVNENSRQFAFGDIDRYLVHTTISFTQTKSIGKEYLTNTLTGTRNIFVEVKLFIR